MILDQFRLDGKTALVTGASAGLGAAMAIALAEAGADVGTVARLWILAVEIDSLLGGPRFLVGCETQILNQLVYGILISSNKGERDEKTSH